MASTAQPLRESASFWSSLRQVFLGAQRDYTDGSISRAISLLAIPMVLEMAMESLFGIVDVFFVARLGADAVATVGLTESLLTPLFAVALGLSMGTTAIVARRIGEKEAEGAALASVQALIAGVAISAVVSVGGFLFAPKLLALMGASNSIIRTGSSYSRVIFGGSSTIFFLFLINAVFRGAGDPSIAMRSLWLANLINIVLNPCLILGLGPFPALGVTGSAVGTTIGRGVGVLYQLWNLYDGRGRVHIRRVHMRLDRAVMKRLLRLSAGGMFQYFINVASWIALVRMAASFGSAAVAGYTLAIRVIIFGILPSWGMSNAAATLVGQNLGARKPERAERSVWVTGLYNMCFLGGLGFLFVCFARPIARIFTSDPAIVDIASSALRIISYGYVFYAYGMVIVQSFNGAGDTNTPTIINFFCYWLWQVPLAWWLAFHTNAGVNGVFAAIAIAESTTAVVGILAFRRGKWKEVRV
jgi:putative MATE family efflux protein